MKIKLQTLLKHKLQWLMLLIALHCVSQVAWGYKGTWLVGSWDGHSAWTNIQDNSTKITLTAGNTYTFDLRRKWDDDESKYHQFGCEDCYASNAIQFNTYYKSGIDNKVKITATITGEYEFKRTGWNGDAPQITVYFPTPITDYCVAGNGDSNWLNNQSWDNNYTANCLDSNGEITFTNVPPGKSGGYVFAIVPKGYWSPSYRYSAYSSSSPTSLADGDAVSDKNDGDDNIMITLDASGGNKDITIKFNRTNVFVITTTSCTAPTITTDVSGDAATYCQGAEATALSVVAGGGSTPYSYQWYKNTSQSTSGASKAGTNSSYTPPTNADGIGTYYYYCVVSSACGQSRQFGYSGAITVDATSVAGDITNYGNKCQGSTVTLGISGNTGTTYQWQSCNTESGEYADITVGGDGSEYSAPTSGSAGSTIYYKIKVKNGVCDWATSTTGRPVTILPIPTNLSFTANATVCKETDKTFTLTHDAAPTGSTYSYEWTYPTTSNWSKKSGGTSSDASAVITVGTANGTVTVTPTLTTSDVGCEGAEKSSAITVQGPADFSVSADPASGYTPWKPITLSTSSSGTAAWDISTDPSFGQAYLSTTSGSSSVLKAPANVGNYTVSATKESGGCSLTKTKTITVTAPDCN